MRIGRRGSKEVRDEERSQVMAAFISAYEQSGNIAASCRAADISRQCYYSWIEKHEEFAQACKNALEDYIDTLEAKGDARAGDGYDKPVFHQGMECGSVKQFSDTVLLAKLKAYRRERYGDSKDISLDLKGSYEVFSRLVDDPIPDGVIEDDGGDDDGE